MSSNETKKLWGEEGRQPTASERHNAERWRIVREWTIAFCEAKSRRDLLAIGERLRDDMAVDASIKDALRPTFAWVLSTLDAETP